MKKTIVALTVAALAATSANAAVVYNQDGTKVEVSGQVRLLLDKSSTKYKYATPGFVDASTSKRVDLLNDSSRVDFSASQELGNGLSAFGFARVKFSDKNFGNAFELDQLYTGFKFDGVGKLSFGKQVTVADGLNASDYTYKLSGVNQVITNGNKVVSFKAENIANTGAHAGLSYVFDDSADKASENNRAVVLAAGYENNFDGLGVKFNTAYSHKKASKTHAEKAFLVASEVSYAGFSFGVDYSQAKATNEQSFSDAFLKTEAVGGVAKVDFFAGKVRALEIGAKYQINDDAKVYGVYKNVKYSNLVAEASAPLSAGSSVVRGPVNGSAKSAKLSGFALGAGYNLHKNVETFVELGREVLKYDAIKQTDSKAHVGLRVHF